MTGYEEKFHALGTPINRCVATEQALPVLEAEEGERVAPDEG